MKALFGAGVHPDAESRIRSAMARGVSLEDAQAPRLGRLFPVVDHSGRVWRERLGTAYQELHAAHGRRPERGPERDLVRWNVATGRETRGREPADDVELKAFVARRDATCPGWYGLRSGADRQRFGGIGVGMHPYDVAVFDGVHVGNGDVVGAAIGHKARGVVHDHDVDHEPPHGANR